MRVGLSLLRHCGHAGTKFNHSGCGLILVGSVAAACCEGPDASSDVVEMSGTSGTKWPLEIENHDPGRTSTHAEVLGRLG